FRQQTLHALAQGVRFLAQDDLALEHQHDYAVSILARNLQWHVSNLPSGLFPRQRPDSASTRTIVPPPRPCRPLAPQLPRRGFPSVVVRTRHIVTATPANQLALVRLERRGARRTILRRFSRCGRF